MHTYNDSPCSACGDLDGCHIPGKVRRTKSAVRYGEACPKVVCLCGSTRFGQAFADALRAETLEGNIVLSVGLLGHAEGLDMDGPVKAMLDELHKRKIDLADEVLVLNVRESYCPACGLYRVSTLNGRTTCCSMQAEARPYVGSSTRGEVEYARATNKRIRWLEQPQE